VVSLGFCKDSVGVPSGFLVCINRSIRNGTYEHMLRATHEQA
jgi:hypothetical protein